MATVLDASFSLSRKSAASSPGLLHRAFLALMEARQRQADREIAAILARRGGIMIDAGGSLSSELRQQGRLPALSRR